MILTSSFWYVYVLCTPLMFPIIEEEGQGFIQYLSEFFIRFFRDRSGAPGQSGKNEVFFRKLIIFFDFVKSRRQTALLSA